MTNEDRDRIITTIATKVDSIHSELSAVNKMILGNGQPGLLHRMTQNEAAVAESIRRTTECPAREAFSGNAQRNRLGNIIAFAACVVSLIAVLVTVASK